MRSDTTPAGSRDLPAIWRATCDRITGLGHGAPDGAAGTAVTTVPGTTVIDVMAHLIDVVTRGTDRYAVPTVRTDVRATLAELMAMWEKTTVDLDGPAGADRDLASSLITVAAMGEHDLRTALGVPGARDDVAVKVALDDLSGRLSDRVCAAGLPALRVTVEQWGTIAGAGHAISCVVADRFEFVRAMSGRRSAAEIRRWNWGVEPDPYLPVISEVRLPDREIRERDPRIPEHMRDREFVL
jgi:hypothetical protein